MLEKYVSSITDGYYYYSINKGNVNHVCGGLLSFGASQPLNLLRIERKHQREEEGPPSTNYGGQKVWFLQLWCSEICQSEFSPIVLDLNATRQDLLHSDRGTYSIGFLDSYM
jgi:hypothetical protein